MKFITEDKRLKNLDFKIVGTPRDKLVEVEVTGHKAFQYTAVARHTYGWGQRKVTHCKHLYKYKKDELKGVHYFLDINKLQEE